MVLLFLLAALLQGESPRPQPPIRTGKAGTGDIGCVLLAKSSLGRQTPPPAVWKAAQPPPCPVQTCREPSKHGESWEENPSSPAASTGRRQSLQMPKVFPINFCPWPLTPGLGGVWSIL